MIDPKVFAHQMMETAQDFLREGKDLVPVVGIITADDVSFSGAVFRDHEEKVQAYAAISEVAKAMNAIACITVNDVYIRKLPTDPAVREEYLNSYQNGQLKGDPLAIDAICVSVKSGIAGEMAWGITCQYRREGNEIHFGTVEECPDGFMNMLPDWR